MAITARTSTLATLAVGLLIGLAGCAPSLYARLVTSPTGPSTVEAAGAAAVPRNWRQHPAILTTTSAGDILAIGDVHGDYDRLVALLQATGIIAKLPASPAKVEWTAGRATLIFPGDMIDKGPQSLAVLTVIQALQASAASKGGKVIAMMGNHEAEFLADPKADKVDDFKDELKAAGIAPKDVAAGRHPLGAFMRSLPLGVKVNDWFFCHAGNTQGKTIRQLESEIQADVDGRGFGSEAVLGEDSVLESRLEPQPWWEREKTAPAAVLARNAKALGVAHVVMGHQPGAVTFADGTSRKKGEIYQKNGLIFLIDGGMSQEVNYSRGSLLRITGPQFATATVVYPDRSTKPLWSR